ncbi:MAG: ROK family protein [Candidatus Omnitrophota bacterium]|nr:ROK family protein [Candidatus Omnitrophota bacterium]
MKYSIGIDIGGTKIAIALGNSRGRILARRLLTTRTGAETRACIQEISEHIKNLISKCPGGKRKITGIGVGVPGAVNSKTGVVPRSPHMKGWQGIKLAKILKANSGLPVLLGNDANAAALAEMHFGLGKNTKDFIYITVSTGVGGGLVVNGRLVEGANYVGGEIGHMTVVRGGNLCNCGKRGCLEAYASGTAVARYVERAVRAGRRSVLAAQVKRREPLAARNVGKAIRLHNDRLARESYRVAGEYLGLGLANLLNILNPSVVSLGGGVWKSAPPEFGKAMRASCKREAWPEAYRSVRILHSKLGAHVGDLGAIALGFQAANA